MKQQKGFTLIEMSIVLLITGAIAVPGLRMFSAMLVNSRVSDTRDQLDVIDSAVITYLIQDDIDPDGEPKMTPLYFGSTLAGGDGPCHCGYDDDVLHPTIVPGFNIAGCGPQPNGCERTARRRLPFADIDGDGLEDPPNVTGSIPFSDFDLLESQIKDAWEENITYEVNQNAPIDGISSNYSGTAYELTSTGGDFELYLIKTYTDLIGMLIVTNHKVD